MELKLSTLTVVALRKAATKTIPIYREIVCNPVYATRLTIAIRNNNLDHSIVYSRKLHLVSTILEPIDLDLASALKLRLPRIK
ncbi:hypothetical protein GC102_05860 [Paenibacillus sp. LMG 31460]|uniref:Uncharacterized protein n=1 Tax=Paenibacillus germinis TaxID=2654979 RepID=A0ABX1YZX3_9BACL|nr:hypothetical protein [Paenibacillus germinis]NOU85309.1 hypothetical protein [Paenibacillus germinis]